MAQLHNADPATEQLVVTSVSSFTVANSPHNELQQGEIVFDNGNPEFNAGTIKADLGAGNKYKYNLTAGWSKTTISLYVAPTGGGVLDQRVPPTITDQDPLADNSFTGRVWKGTCPAMAGQGSNNVWPSCSWPAPAGIIRTSQPP
jgi:hypothetical protein